MVAVKTINRIEDTTSLKSERKGINMLNKIIEVLNVDEAGQAKLKELLGDSTLITNDGKYIPRERLNEESAKLKELQSQLDGRDKQLKELEGKAGNSEELNKTIKELQDLNATQKTEYETKTKAQQLNYKFEQELAKHQPKNAKAVKALFDMEKISLDGDNLLGFNEQMTPIKEANDFLFGQTVVNGNPPPKNPGGNTTPNQKADLITRYNDAEKAGNATLMNQIATQIRKIKE